MDFDAQSIADKMWDIVKDGNCIAWVGAGLSEGAGYKSWEEAIVELSRRCLSETLKLEDISKLSAEMLMVKAEDCLRANDLLYKSTLAELYGNLDTQARRGYELLVKLPFRAIFTTNFDPILADICKRECNVDCCAYPNLRVEDFIKQPKKTPFYLHGIATDEDFNPNGEDLVFCKSEFAKAYGLISFLPSFLQQTLPSYPILFIGSGLQEVALQAVLKNTHQMLTQHNVIPPKRIMLLNTPKIIVDPIPNFEIPTSIRDKFNSAQQREGINNAQKEKEQQRLEALHIDVEWYTPCGSSHNEVDKVIEAMCKLAGVWKKPRIRFSLQEDSRIDN